MDSVIAGLFKSGVCPTEFIEALDLTSDVIAAEEVQGHT